MNLNHNIMYLKNRYQINIVIIVTFHSTFYTLIISAKIYISINTNVVTLHYHTKVALVKPVPKPL